MERIAALNDTNGESESVIILNFKSPNVPKLQNYVTADMVIYLMTQRGIGSLGDGMVYCHDTVRNCMVYTQNDVVSLSRNIK